MQSALLACSDGRSGEGASRARSQQLPGSTRAARCRAVPALPAVPLGHAAARRAGRRAPARTTTRSTTCSAWCAAPRPWRWPARRPRPRCGRCRCGASRATTPQATWSPRRSPARAVRASRRSPPRRPRAAARPGWRVRCAARGWHRGIGRRAEARMASRALALVHRRPLRAHAAAVRAPNEARALHAGSRATQAPS